MNKAADKKLEDAMTRQELLNDKTSREKIVNALAKTYTRCMVTLTDMKVKLRGRRFRNAYARSNSIGYELFNLGYVLRDFAQGDYDFDYRPVPRDCFMKRFELQE